MLSPRLAVFIVALILTGCSTDAADIEGEWNLTSGSLDGVEILPRERSGDIGGTGRPVTLVIDDYGATGNGPCNDYGGPLDIDALLGSGAGPLRFGLEWGDVFSTLRGCLAPGIEAIEHTYFTALLGTVQGRRLGDSLTLIGDDLRLEYEIVDDDGDRNQRSLIDVQRS